MKFDVTNATIAEFFNIFSGDFNVDLINIDNDDEVKAMIVFCASTVEQRVLDVPAVIFYLEDVLANWNGRRIAPFIDSTSLDWLWDDKSEQTLKLVVQGIVSELKPLGKHRSPKERS